MVGDVNFALAVREFNVSHLLLRTIMCCLVSFVYCSISLREIKGWKIDVVMALFEGYNLLWLCNTG